MSPTITHRAFNVDDLEKFVLEAKPGAVCLYHTGFLMVDRDMAFGGDANVHLVHRVGLFAEALHNQNLVYLVQNRVGDFHYEYLAIRSSRESAGLPAEIKLPLNRVMSDQIHMVA